MERARVVAALQVALHLLFAALLALALWRAAHLDGDVRTLAMIVGGALTCVYGAGAVFLRGRARRGDLAATVWTAVLILLWALLVVHVPDAAYLAFPLFFLSLHLLGPVTGPVSVVAVCTIAVASIGLRSGWTTGGVVGPVVAAAAALAIGAGYRALLTESSRRQALIDELVATRAELADREREAGREGERARLAAEIHDTVAQGLSSVQMLLHSVERASPDHPGIETVRLARRTAGDNLVETRRLLAALRPAALEGTTLGPALTRTAAALSAPLPTGADGRPRPLIEVESEGLRHDPSVPVASALLRVAQEAVTNAVKHAGADTVTVLVRDTDPPAGAGGAAGIELRVVDDGHGFDAGARVPSSSFGLAGMRDRVEGLGGTFEVRSEPGRGTVVCVRVPPDPVSGTHAGTGTHTDTDTSTTDRP